MYRRRDLVEYSGANGGRVSLISAFPTMFSPEPKKAAAPQELVSALESGQLAAEGIRVGGSGVRQAIPSSEWVGVMISGERVSWTSAGKTIPNRWRDITLESAAVLQHWRAPIEIEARTKFDWSVIREMHDEMRARHPGFSQNELINELQGAYRDRFNKEPPSRTAFQRQIRKWP